VPSAFWAADSWHFTAGKKLAARCKPCAGLEPAPNTRRRVEEKVTTGDRPYSQYIYWQ